MIEERRKKYEKELHEKYLQLYLQNKRQKEFHSLLKVQLK